MFAENNNYIYRKYADNVYTSIKRLAIFHLG